LVYPKDGYLGINYTPIIIFIQVFWVAGRTTDVKKAYGCGSKMCLDNSKLADSAREDWSFGDGEMQYAPK
jgi:4-oxalocrotonate tautomerase